MAKDEDSTEELLLDEHAWARKGHCGIKRQQAKKRSGWLNRGGDEVVGRQGGCFVRHGYHNACAVLNYQEHWLWKQAGNRPNPRG